ncbi:MAG: hypothetical protein IB617_02985 [Candidatus Nealsonbacteria bacterium]|nr:MAG: hypothetical protein IB617_02985 [Candidatus Nealsonbacteria bacterium]
MIKPIKLQINNINNPYHEIAVTLEKYKNRKTYSVRFIVEGSIKDPIVAIDYPGRKMFKRVLKTNRKNTRKWANLFDFRVVPHQKGKALRPEEFTFDKLLVDFKDNKSGSEKFWEILQGMYYTNRISKKPPKLKGINPELFLLTLRWIWIEEDFNYRLKWEDVQSKAKYVLAKINKKTGKEQAVSRGAGRAKFFAVLVLLKRKDFSYEEVKKIIPLY